MDREIPDDRPDARVNILAICTGNVARSAMLGFMLTSIAHERGSEWSVRSAGTHVIEGSTMSSRTRDALLSIAELGDHRFSAHRSHQLTPHDVAWADVVLAAEADHVRFTRGLAPREVTRVVQVRQFVLHAPPGEPIERQLAVVSGLELDATLDVADPAGGDQGDYDAIARSLWHLARDFATLTSA
jgi:protein-tyrosine-phosphatase